MSSLQENSIFFVGQKPTKIIKNHGPKTDENNKKPTKLTYIRRHADEINRRMYLNEILQLISSASTKLG